MNEDVFVDRYSGVVVRSSVEIERLEDGSYSVLWDDGSTSQVERRLPQRITRFANGSVKHRAVVEPEKLLAEFAADPGSLFTAILRENTGPMRSQELTTAAIGAGLDGAAVRAAWPKVRQSWQKNPNVRLAGNPPSFEWAQTTREESLELSTLPVMDLLEQLVASDQGSRADEPAKSAVRARLRDSQELPERLAAASLKIVPWPTTVEVARLMQGPLTTGAEIAGLSDQLLTTIAQAAVEERRRDLFWLLSTTTRPARPLARLSELLRADPDIDDSLTRVLGRLSDALLDSSHDAEEAVAEQVSVVVARIGPAALRPEPVTALLSLLVIAPSSSTTLTETVLRLLPDVRPEVLKEAIESDDSVEILASANTVPLIPGSGRAALLAVAGEFDLEGLTATKTWTGVSIGHLVRMAEADELRSVLDRDDVGTTVVAPLAEAAMSSATDRRQLATILAWPQELLDHVDTAVLAGSLIAISAHDQTIRGLIEHLVADREKVNSSD